MRILIIEDEETAVERLKKMIGAELPASTILGDLDSIETTLTWFQQHDMPDLIFLDIHLADGLSFEIFKQVDITCPIIFTTAYDQYAIQAFKVNAIDYLLKPIKQAELAKSIEKYKKLQPTNFDYYNLLQAVQQQTPQKFQQRFLIRFGQKLKIIEVENIAYFFIQDRIVLATTFEGKHYPMDVNLDKLEAMLNPKQFFRINRQVMARITAIKEMYAYSKSRVRVTFNPPLKQEVIVSQERSAKFKAWLVGN